MGEIIELKNETQPENQLKDAIDSILAFSPEGEGAEEIFATLLEMEDEQFSVIAPVFLDELAKSFNNAGAQLLMTNVMNQQGIKYEDLVNSYQKIIDTIDTEIDDNTLSQPKKSFIKQMLMLIINAIGETQATTKRIIEIPVVLDNEAKIPTYANVGDAGADLYAAEEYTLNPGDQVLVKTGLKMAIPFGYALIIQPRSGLSTKSKLRIPNTPGLIDSGYRGEICVPMENIEPRIKDLIIDEDGKATGIFYGSSYTIEKGERIAQARLVEVPTIAFNEVSELEASERGEGGFGSSGMN